MRTIYKQERDKMRASKRTDSAPEDMYAPSVVWYEITDRFLGGVMDMRNKFTNLLSFFDLFSTFWNLVTYFTEADE